MIQSRFERAENFIWQNARLLERRLYTYYFKSGSSQDVVYALRAYQNEDGGFGNALEPDIRCPDSQPVPVQHALKILAKVEPNSELVSQACDYLMTITTDEGGVPWLLPSALDYPRAPWWQTEEGAPSSLNPTAAIVGVLHEMDVDHPWLEPATAYCWAKILEYQPRENGLDDMGCVLSFLYQVPDRPQAERELARLIEQMFAVGLVSDADAEGYVRKPLDWAPTPDHPLRTYFRDEDVQTHLDFIIANQQEDGGWPINWPPFSPGCELEWRGGVTLNTLRILEANGRLDG